MHRAHLAALVLAGSALAALGCGASARTTTDRTTASDASLTRAQLIARGDAICRRLNARRSSTRVSTRADYERLMPPLVSAELAGAAEMSKLVPPPSMAGDWRAMVSGSRAIAQVTGHFTHYADASSAKEGRSLDAILTKGIQELTGAARRAGFSQCARFE